MNRFSRWLVVLVGVVLCLYPFLWMFLSSFKTNREIYQPTLLFPDSYDWGAYASLFGGEYLSFFTFSQIPWPCLADKHFWPPWYP